MADELKIHSYPKHIGDWRSGTGKLSLAEKGAYGELMDEYYQCNGQDWTLIECYRICSAITPEEQKAVRRVLAKKFEKVKRGYRHAGMDRRIVEIEEASAKSQARARKGAEGLWRKKRGEKCAGDASSMLQASGKQCESISQNPKGESESKDSHSPDARVRAEETFKDFVKAWPGEVGPEAADAWVEALDGGADPAEVLRGMAARLGKWTPQAQKAAEASNFLRARRWEGVKPPDGVTHTAAPIFPDAEIRAAVVAEGGEGLAVSCLDRAEWRPPVVDGDVEIAGTIVTTTESAAIKLRRLSCLNGKFNIVSKQSENAA